MKPSDALMVGALCDKKQYDKAADIVSSCLKRDLPNLKVIWFYPRNDAGGTGRSMDQHLEFDLEAVGDWVGSNADIAFLFTDNAYGKQKGYALAWEGTPIPPEFVRLISEYDRSASGA